MKKQELAEIIRSRAAVMSDAAPDGDGRLFVLDNAELLRVLARIVDGQPVESAFGPPGDWGYATLIGKALVGR